MSWKPMHTAPKGVLVDLWIQGVDDTVDFYCPNAKKIKNKPARHGRTTDWMLDDSGHWRQKGGLGYALSPEVTPVAWRYPPEPPRP